MKPYLCQSLAGGIVTLTKGRLFFELGLATNLLSMKYYYMFWVRLIYVKTEINRDDDWKWKLLMLISSLEGVVLIIIYAIFRLSGFEIVLPQIHFFESDKLNNGLMFLLYFMSWPLLLNYFLILHNNQYKYLLEKYDEYKNVTKIPERIFIMFMLFIGLSVVFLIFQNKLGLFE